GFAGGEVFDPASLAVRDFVLNETILSGDLLGNDIADPLDVGYAASKADNTYHVVASRNNSLGAILDGFTIQHGFADGAGSITEGLEEISQNSGGGIYLRASGMNTQYNIKHINFKHNTALNGGGLYINLYDGIPTVNVENSTFSN